MKDRLFLRCENITFVENYKKSQLPSNIKYILPIIIIAQLFCTSLWFAGNGVMTEIMQTFQLNNNVLGYFTSSVQLGFIVGTFSFAFFAIADRFSPSKVFLCSALLGAIFNLGIIWENNNLQSLLFLRFATGFFLAGIYPVGMKIATDYFDKNLGKSLGFLVGALVVGTALPHLLKNFITSFSWTIVIISTSTLATFGGFLIALFVPDGPYRKTTGKSLNLSDFFSIFQHKNCRIATLGYVGHMWELYAFWAFVPIILGIYNHTHQLNINIALLSFFVIASGGIGCVLSGYLAQKLGTKKIATLMLLASCVCCLILPLLFQVPSFSIFIIYLIFWGMVVVADSPLFSTLVAQNTPAHLKGTALTMVSCVGFSITIVSIQTLSFLTNSYQSTMIFWVLALGPLLGLWALYKK